MAQDSIVRCYGLISQYNPLAIQSGALIQADNCNIRRENIIENRRGYKVYGSVPNTPTQMMLYSDRVLVHNGTTISYDNGSGTFSSYAGTYSAPTGRLMQHEPANSNMYITTSNGVFVLQDVAGTAARAAGAPRALDISYSLTGASGFLSNSYQCAYRAVFKRIDQNGNTLIGYPSQRLWVANSAGGSRNTSLTMYLPSTALAGDEVQFYRTAQVSGTSTDTSGDEMGLVFSYVLAAGDITAGYITVTDQIVDALRGETIYTAPSQQGIEGANEVPPLALDLALFKSNYMFFANTQTKQRLYITLVGTSGLSGNTVTLSGVTYSFGASENISTGTVAVSATGTAAVDIDLTARSLCRVINRYATNTSIYAYYLSGAEDLPGQILLEARTLGTSAFTALSSNTTISGMFNPPPPVSTPNAKSTSSNDINKNGLFYSKANEPEHVPLANYIAVGPANTNIRRIAALRDSLIIIKDEGIYRLTGADPNSFTVAPLDLTVKCKATNSVSVLNNEVYMLANQGVVKISDTGVEVISRAIEPDLLTLLQFSSINSLAYGYEYESDKTYMLSVPSDSVDTANTQQYVYNTFTRCWTRFTFGISAAHYESSNDKLYFVKPGSTSVFQERKTYSNDDYVDPDYSITITGIATNSITFTLSSATPKVGWVIEQGITRIVVTAITNNGGNSYTATTIFPPPSSWTTGSAKIYPGVDMEVKWDTWSGNAPGIIKQVRQIEVLADNTGTNSSASSLVQTFSTDISENDEEVTVYTNVSNWGTTAWGGFVWGGVKDNFGYPTYVPRNFQYCRLMNPGVKFVNGNERLSIAGIVLTYEPVSERTGK